MPTTLHANNSLLQPAPHSLEAEQALLGAVLLDNAALSLVRDTIKPEDFYRTGHQVIFQTMLNMADGGHSIDNITLTEALSGHGKLTSIGGASYLGELITTVPSAANIATHARLVVEKSRIRTLRNHLIDAMHSIEHGAEWDALAPMVAQLKDLTNETAPASTDGMCFRRVDTIEAQPIRWLWTGRIARGKVSMIAGNPGLGKSQVTASMTAIVSTGGTWPVDKTPCEVGNTIILSAEDDPADTIRPRLEVAGANLTRVYILDAIVAGTLADGNEIRRGFDLKMDLTRLGAMVEEIGGATLIVIDPITAYLGTTDSHKNADIRALLSPLAEFAAKHEAAVVCVNHFNKNSAGEAIMRVTGSLAFVAAARAVFVVARDPEDDARRLFLPLKNNLGNDQTGLAFTVKSAQLKSPHGSITTSHVVWEGGAVTTTAEEAMSPQETSEERGELADAKNFLQALLVKGPVSSKDIQADARDAGHSWRTIQRAQQALGIVAYKMGMKEGWAWRLPGPTPAQESQTSPTSPTLKSWHSSHSSGAVGGLQEGQVETVHTKECQIPSEECQESPKNTKNAMFLDEPPSGAVGQLQGKTETSDPEEIVIHEN